VVDHLEHGLQHADDGAIGAVHAFVESAQSVEMTEELVGAVDEVNDHFAVNEDLVAAVSKAVVQLATTEMYLQRAIDPSLP
jgi:hypothetical protein